MTDDSSAYNLNAIHELLVAAFSAQELRRFCRDRSLFKPILRNFGPNDSLNQMADKVIDYCVTHHLLDELLEAVEEENPRQYALFADRLRSSAPPAQTPPTTPAPPTQIPPTKPPPPSEPASDFKDFVSKPIVWIVLVALLLMVGTGLFVVNPILLVETVALKTAHNRYATALDGNDIDLDGNPNWEIIAETEVVDKHERFTLLCFLNGKVAFHTWHQTAGGKHRYVTARGVDKDWVLDGETDVLDDWEVFTLLDVETEKRRNCFEVIRTLRGERETRVALQTWHEKEDKHRLVTAMDGNWEPPWVLRAETNVLGPSEKFIMKWLP